MKTIVCLLVTLYASAGAFALAFPIAVQAQVTEQINGDVAQMVSTALLSKHLRQDVDRKQLSREWTRQFMLRLDPLRMHFLASDADAFHNQSPSLLPDAEKGDAQFPELVAKRFRKRLNANTPRINKLLATEHDFTIDEAVQIEHLTYAASKKERDERWRLRIKYELLMEKRNGRDKQAARKFLGARYLRIQERFQALTSSKTLSLYLDCLAESFDPHSRYIEEDLLTLYRTSQIPTPAIGRRLEYRRGDLWLRPSGNHKLNGPQPFTARRVIAVRESGKPAVHLIGLPYGDAHRTIISPIGELGFNSKIILELDDPRRGYRETVIAYRWPPRQ